MDHCCEITEIQEIDVASSGIRQARSTVVDSPCRSAWCGSYLLSSKSSHGRCIHTHYQVLIHIATVYWHYPQIYLVRYPANQNSNSRNLQYSKLCQFVCYTFDRPKRVYQTQVGFHWTRNSACSLVRPDISTKLSPRI